jgi:hypothetical protein
MHPVAICPEVGRLHRVARHNLQQANHARRTIDYYRIHPEVDPYTPVVELRHKATIAAERASEGEPSSEVVSAWAYDYAQATRWEG